MGSMLPYVAYMDPMGYGSFPFIFAAYFREKTPSRSHNKLLDDITPARTVRLVGQGTRGKLTVYLGKKKTWVKHENPWVHWTLFFRNNQKKTTENLRIRVFRRNWSTYMVGFFLSRLVSWSLSKFDQVLGPENFENHLNETTLKLVIMFNLSVNRIVFPFWDSGDLGMIRSSLMFGVIQI